MSFQGRSHSPEARARIAAAHKGRAKSPEVIAKLSAANKGREGRPLTPAQRDALKASKRNANPLTAGFNDQQMADFKLFKAKGFTAAEAAELARTAPPPKPKRDTP